MKSEPKAVLRRLRNKQLDPDSTVAQEMVEEVAERVLRNLTPREESQYFPGVHLPRPEPSEAS